ncbi:hypothetical protein GGR56DRAFT_611657 [Xylariaceae sp. FL0804]|nr:hypothetical protein GGR56DRAFT_611657 [Xylariaceae sp. FL0804]
MARISLFLFSSSGWLVVYSCNRVCVFDDMIYVYEFHSCVHHLSYRIVCNCRVRPPHHTAASVWTQSLSLNTAGAVSARRNHTGIPSLEGCLLSATGMCVLFAHSCLGVLCTEVRRT